LETIKKDKQNEKKNLEDISSYIEQIEKELKNSDDKTNDKTRLRELNSKENEIKNQIKKLETLYFNEIQLSLGEEFKSDSLKENKDNLKKKEKDILDEINELESRNKHDKVNILSTRKNLEKLKLNSQRIQSELVEKKKEIENCNNKKVLLNENIKQILERIESQSRKLAEKQTEIKTLNLISGENYLTNDSIVNLIKIKKGYENAVYAALSYELDAKLKKSKKRWIGKQTNDEPPIDNALINFVDAPSELRPLLSQIKLIEDEGNAIKLQKNLKTGQFLVSQNGSIWRWDGFFS
jgi:chromosome segregation protein